MATPVKNPHCMEPKNRKHPQIEGIKRLVYVVTDGQQNRTEHRKNPFSVIYTPSLPNFGPKYKTNRGKKQSLFPCGFTNPLQVGDFLLHLVTNSSKIRGIVEAI